MNEPASRVHLAMGLLERDGRLLMVASRYPNHPLPLWNLPGGRQRDGELLEQTVRREFLEETGLTVEVGSVRYVSESYDRTTNVHFLSIAFDVRLTSIAFNERAANTASGERAASTASDERAASITSDERAASITSDERAASITSEERSAHIAADERATSGASNEGATDEPFVPPGDAHAVALAWVPFASIGATVTVPVVREPLLTHLADPSRRYFGFDDAGITIAFADPP